MAALAIGVSGLLCGMGGRPSARQQFRAIRHYACYYGPDRLEDLAKYDLVILETDHHRPAEIQRLRAAGTLVLGYLSVGQTLRLEHGDGRGPTGSASWYLDRLSEAEGALREGADGQPDRDPEWGSYYVDPASRLWQRRLEAAAQRLLKEWRCNGIFLDTLLYPYAYDEAFRQERIAPGIARCVERLRRAHPGAVLVANNGWAYLDRLGPLLDGIMYENFTGRYRATEGTLREEADRTGAALNAYRARQKRLPLVILTLDYAAPEDTALFRQALARAEEYGFVPGVSGEDAAGNELYVLATVNPANALVAVRSDRGVEVTWQADPEWRRQAGVSRFILKRSGAPIRTQAEWEAAELVSDRIEPSNASFVDHDVPPSVRWYAIGAVHQSGMPLVGHAVAQVRPAEDW